jgi:hypothetical protein
MRWLITAFEESPSGVVALRGAQNQWTHCNKLAPGARPYPYRAPTMLPGGWWRARPGPQDDHSKIYRRHSTISLHRMTTA